jgi:hypothetical protein
MAWGFSKPLALTGPGFTNLYAAMQAAGFTSHPIAHGQVVLQDMDNATDCYIHFNGTRLVAPSTGTDGIPFGPTAGASVVYNLPKGTDLSTVWLYCASNITVNCSKTPESSLI